MSTDPTDHGDGGEDAWVDDPSNDDQVDDLDEGDVGGDDDAGDLSDAGTELDATAAVERWRIVAVGRRPEDFLGRDCLYGSLLRDHRVPWFRRYLRKPDPWMEASPPTFAINPTGVRPSSMWR